MSTRSSLLTRSFHPVGIDIVPQGLHPAASIQCRLKTRVAGSQDQVGANTGEQVRGLLRSPEIIVRTFQAARETMDGLSEADVRAALQRLDPLWDELFPGEQARVVQLLVERVDIAPDSADIRMRTEGLTKLIADLGAVRPDARRTA